ncbi:Adenylosuccinate synthetase [Globodera pallida]|nr:Adenylosuccinate synthetase [Globodera pallida]
MMNGTLTNGRRDCGVTVLLGAQWGDEGKGKVLDFLIGHHKVDVVARCQGGNNAGHTVVANGRVYDFHLLPSGLASEQVLNIIGNGVVVNLDAFFEELARNGFDSSTRWEKRLFISDSAHLVLPVHIKADGLQENALGQSLKLGTTKRGIGPTYSSKCFRNGIRLGELLYDPSRFEKNYLSMVTHYGKLFPEIQLEVEADLRKLKAHAEHLIKLDIVRNTTVLLHQMRLKGKSILVEGANGTLLDIDFGTYPYVTSSNSTVGGCCTGLGIPPTAIRRVIGVVKAYQTRVGSGPFPTELLGADGQPNEEGTQLQELGAEVGVTTGRKRRCGWLDLVLLRYSTMINGFTSLAVTKVDILDKFSKIKVAIGYELNGKTLEYPPTTDRDWGQLRVHYKTFEGWQSSTTDARNWDQLPEKCRAYLEFIQEQMGVPVGYIGVGKGREQLIVIGGKDEESNNK